MSSGFPAAGGAARAERRSIFVVDDHPIFRRGLVALIETEPDLEVCGQAGSAVQAIEGLRHMAADAAVLDVSLPGTNGLELLKHLRAEHPKLPILIVSAHDEQVYAMRGLKAGAAGYLMKRESEEKLIGALRRVLSGNVYVSPAFGERLIYKVAHGQQPGRAPGIDLLTDRELEMLQLVGAGHSSREIADLLHLSVKTIESHRLHIKEKLQLGSAAELVRFATEWVEHQQV